MSDPEIWKPVKGYKQYYEVSSHGRVRSLERIVKNKRGIKHLWKSRIRKAFINPKGYEVMTLTVDKKVKTTRVHRLVAEAFIPNPSKYKEINHKDGNKVNNHRDNLEWCSGDQNLQHAINNGLNKTKPVIRLSKNKVNYYNSLAKASRESKVSIPSISKCCKGILHSAGGYNWRYA